MSCHCFRHRRTKITAMWRGYYCQVETTFFARKAPALSDQSEHGTTFFLPVWEKVGPARAPLPSARAPLHHTHTRHTPPNVNNKYISLSLSIYIHIYLSTCPWQPYITWPSSSSWLMSIHHRYPFQCLKNEAFFKGECERQPVFSSVVLFFFFPLAVQ